MCFLRFALLSLLATGLVASEVIRPPPVPPPTIKLPPEEQPVRLTDLAIAVSVAGLQAETVTTMTFHNPNGRVLAGELEFPLPDGATVCGYALDVDGQMVDGVIVPKDKGRVVMETEMRRRVDPGLVEHVRGNLFRTRVYPIPAQGSRTITVVHVAELSLSDDGAACHVPLPRTSLPRLDLRVEVAAGAGKPELGGFGDLVLNGFERRWVAEATLQTVTPDDDLYIRLPQLGPELVSLERHQDETYVAISHAPELPQSGGTASAERIAVAWDASGSRDPAAVARDRAVLAAVVARLGCGVDLRVFRNAPAAWQHFAPGPEGAQALAAHLDALAYDGGTDLAALDLRRDALPAAAQAADRWLLFTDGLHTLGDGLPRFGALPVDVIAGGSRRDRGVQRLIASATGGRLIDASTTAAARAAQMLCTGQATLLRVEAPAGALADVQYAYAAGSGRATVYARVRGDCTATLVYGRPGGAGVLRHPVELRRAEAVAGRVIARAWAGARVAELAVFPERNAEKLLHIGRRYGLVTPGTSLIVLENLQQYLEHEIEPPASWPSMRERYFAALKGRRQREGQRVEDKLATVLGWWRERVAWWERDFPRHAEVKVAQGEAREGEAREVVARGREEALTGMARQLASRDAPATAARPADTGGAGGFDLAVMEAAPSAELAADGLTDKAAGAPSTAAAIAIQAWDPDTPYLAALREAPAAEVYPAYLAQRAQHASSPAFYLDCAGAILAHDRALGLRVLSNLAELRIDDPALLRIYAWRLQEAGALDRAIELLERVRRLRAEDPQSHRDLALLLGRRGEQQNDREDLTRAVRLLYDVIIGDWQRFAQIEVIAAMELNRCIALAEAMPGGDAADFSYIDSRLRKLLDCDVRIVLSWDADNTDIDLHVIEPSGERAYYGNNRTVIGGLVSRDFTQGYGPEEYLVRRAMPGTYRIRCRYYGSSQQTLVGPATVTATVITNFGRSDERRQDLTLRLDTVKETVDIGAITIGPDAGPQATGGTITRKQIEALHQGMTRTEVEAALGASERDDGSGITILVYRLADGTALRLGLAPDLIWAREIHDGAERAIPLAADPGAGD